MTRLLTLVADAQHAVQTPTADERVLTLDELGALRRQGALRGMILRFPRTRILVPDLDSAPPSLKAALATRALSRGRCWTEDHQGRRRAIGARYLLVMSLKTAWALVLARRILRRTHERLDMPSSPGPVATRVRQAPPIYIRTDLVFGLRAGGAVAHTAGVVNGLATAGMPPIVLTPAQVPTLRRDIEVHIVPPDVRWNQRELMPQLAYTERAVSQALSALGNRRPSFVYQRSSIGSLAGLELARRLQTPFVLEFNGSDVWIARNWGSPLHMEALALGIEEANVRGAHLVTVVSEPLRETVLELGCEERRVLVNPNGVDLDRFHPEVNGAPVRRRLGIAPGDLVVGFIGTFGRWHGAEVLAEAYVRLRRRWDAPGAPRLLLIGDGLTRPQAQGILERGGYMDAAILAGVVPAEDAPAHLAACDILVSPHVPNPDGTPFFGSPTKLFEYLAMGKGIVASDLDQIGAVLDHERTALLVPPGDPGALAHTLHRLLRDADLRERLGTAARQAAQRYSWDTHVSRIIAALDGVLDAAA